MGALGIGNPVTSFGGGGGGGHNANNKFVLIDQQEVSGAAVDTVTFSGLSATYDWLVLVGRWVVADAGSVGRRLSFFINGAGGAGGNLSPFYSTVSRWPRAGGTGVIASRTDRYQLTGLMTGPGEVAFHHFLNTKTHGVYERQGISMATKGYAGSLTDPALRVVPGARKNERVVVGITELSVVTDNGSNVNVADIQPGSQFKLYAQETS